MHAVTPLRVCSSEPAALPAVNFSRSAAHASLQVPSQAVVVSSPALVLPDNDMHCIRYSVILFTSYLATVLKLLHVQLTSSVCTGIVIYTVYAKKTDPND